MKLLVILMLVCFATGFVVRNRPAVSSNWLVFGVSTMLAVGYYFFNQI